MTTKDDWLNRKMVTRVLDRCDHCETLQEKVQQRQWNNYAWGSAKRSVDMLSCEPCFDKAVTAEKARPSDAPHFDDPFAYLKRIV